MRARKARQRVADLLSSETVFGFGVASTADVEVKVQKISHNGVTVVVTKKMVTEKDKVEDVVIGDLDPMEMVTFSPSLSDACCKGDWPRAKKLIEMGVTINGKVFSAENLCNCRAAATFLRASSCPSSSNLLLLVPTSVVLLTCCTSAARASAGQNKSGSTVLMDAVWFGHLEIVKLLIDCGAKPNIRNGRKNTALHFAYEKGWDAVWPSMRGTLGVLCILVCGRYRNRREENNRVSGGTRGDEESQLEEQPRYAFSTSACTSLSSTVRGIITDANSIAPLNMCRSHPRAVVEKETQAAENLEEEVVGAAQRGVPQGRVCSCHGPHRQRCVKPNRCHCVLPQLPHDCVCFLLLGANVNYQDYNKSTPLMNAVYGG